MVSLHSAVAYWARREPGRSALVYAGQRTSYQELEQRSQHAAGLLAARGIGKGDVVALLMKNSSAFIEFALAVGHLGAVLLPVNYRLGTAEVAYILQHAEARLLLVDDEFAHLAGDFANALSVDEAAQHDSRRLGPATPVTQAVDLTPDDLFRLMYTSGTTDRPKGVIHTYQNYHWKCMDHTSVLGLDQGTRLLIAGPLYHVGAFDLPGLAVLANGGMLAVLRDFSEQEALTLIASEKLDGAWLAPVMLSRLLAVRDMNTHDTSSMRWVIGGGERTPEQRIRDFGWLFGRARYIDAYGLTETCSGDTMMDPGREIEKIGSAGRALPHVLMSIRDDAGRVLPAGTEGEICLSGPKVTRGYWRDEARTRESFHGAWFRTGDVGYLDEEGFLFLTDRKKDMIVSGGENIASSEVERVLYEMPEVAEVAAVGLPDERWGECVVAVVVPHSGKTLDMAALRAFCDGRLGGFKIPRRLVIRESLPRTPSGKVLKRVLRQELLGG